MSILPGSPCQARQNEIRNSARVKQLDYFMARPHCCRTMVVNCGPAVLIGEHCSLNFSEVLNSNGVDHEGFGTDGLTLVA